MIGNDLNLGEMDTEDELEFPPAERKVVTQPYDLSVQTLLEQWETNVPILPAIQREYVWDNGRASRLIESLLLNIPVPVLYFAETSDARYEIIDGHQRVRSIARFVRNEFRLNGLRVLSEYSGKYFHQLPSKEQRFLKMRTLRAIIIGHDSHASMKFEIFESLNSGTIILNSQELRNSLYRGPFNELLHQLVNYSTFRRIIGSKRPRRRMVAGELILRFFALRENYAKYRVPLKRFLNEYMSSVKDASEEELGVFEETFTTTVERAYKFIGGHAFRITDKRGRTKENVVNRALFECQMLAFSWVENDDPSRQDTLRELDELYRSHEFMDSIQRATGDRSRTLYRIKEMVAALERAGFRCGAPKDLGG